MASGDVEVVRGLYGAFARGDIGAATAAMAPDIVWLEAEGFAYADGNPYVGPDAVVRGVFARLGGEWNGFAAVIDEILDAGDRVVALGRYTGTFKATGKAINAQVVHVWTLAGGKLAAFQQHADTLQLAKAMQA